MEGSGFRDVRASCEVCSDRISASLPFSAADGPDFQSNTCQNNFGSVKTKSQKRAKAGCTDSAEKGHGQTSAEFGDRRLPIPWRVLHAGCCFQVRPEGTSRASLQVQHVNKLRGARARARLAEACPPTPTALSCLVNPRPNWYDGSACGQWPGLAARITNVLCGWPCYDKARPHSTTAMQKTHLL